uniref:Similar to mudrA protein putative n=1 Tax=Albugo laibachii Nc14 TaxID=890382 RepID=F0X0H5_9STRA|nr:Similar to mudrA protein putative [Albugo laibachii Nc14]|eukprot:CCA27265.1 Similar to mudrA protein putative [Albugo laibachii Nc14]
MTGESFFRLALVFREGIHTFQHYAPRGLCVDGTFLKTTVGGILLVACFCNGNMELQIIAITVVSIENQDNWVFFLKFLLAHLIQPPAFIVSGRDKGLIPAVKAIESIHHHLNCFRRIMENSNTKFKSKQMKRMAWNVARA